MKQLIKRKITICALTILAMACVLIITLDRAEARITLFDVQSVAPAGPATRRPAAEGPATRAATSVSSRSSRTGTAASRPRCRALASVSLRS